MTIRFTRLASSNVLAQVHVSDDSRYIILPKLAQSTSVHGWIVYDTVDGEFLEPKEYVEGCKDGVWSYLAEARKWVEETYYRKETA